MSSGVIWEDYVTPKPKDINSDDIEHVESMLGVSFPTDYKALIVKEQGRLPLPETISSSELFCSTFGPLYHLDISLNDTNGIIYKWDRWKDYYGQKVIPIAGTGGGACFFAYVYSDDLLLPSIFFVDVEDEELLFVARSITELIQNLV